VQGLAASTATAAGLAQAAPPARTSASPAVMSGTEFDLRIGETDANITGRSRRAITVNGSLPAPLLRWKEGTDVTLRVTNMLPVTTSIHWHGIILPADMDGVPGVSFDGIAPGETFVYRFPVRQSGTYWYHSHSGFQEQLGLYGALVIDPAGPEPVQADADHVLVFSDWTDEEPERVLRKLKASADYYIYQQPTVGDFFSDVSTIGWSAAWEKRRMWNRMRMNPTDVADITAATYTYLANGKPPAANHTILTHGARRIRLRLVNAGASSIFDVRIPGLAMTVVSADGVPVIPVTVDELRIVNAETYDVIVEPAPDRAYTVFAQHIDRMGYARATLAPRDGMMAPVPPLDPPGWLAMEDMGMGGQPGMDHGSPPPERPAAEHGTHSLPSGGDMQPAKQPRRAEAAGHEASSGADLNPIQMPTGPSVEMRSMSPGPVVTDPGPRLRGTGRRALAYVDLRTVGGPLDSRPAGRDIVLRLTGNMRRYIWGMDGKKYSEAEPIRLSFGERVRFVLVNDTMMTHPMHLHGMWSEIEDEKGRFLVRKHTMSVHPGKYIAFQVTADARGQWAFHCHHLYHMEAGMFRKVVVE
jgi:CopA family copper-resistance protein